MFVRTICFLLGEYLRVELLGHTVKGIFIRNSQNVFRSDYTFPLAIYENIDFSTSWPTLGIVGLFNDISLWVGFCFLFFWLLVCFWLFRAAPQHMEIPRLGL